MSTAFPSPKIEDYVKRRAFERRAHTLDENGSYRVRSSLGWVAYGGVLGASLPDLDEGTTLMWVDFVRHTQTGVSIEDKMTIASRLEGEVAIAIGPREFSTAEEIMAEGLETDYLKKWVDQYWPEGQAASFVERKHPAIEPVRLLRSYITKLRAD